MGLKYTVVCSIYFLFFFYGAALILNFNTFAPVQAINPAGFVLINLHELEDVVTARISPFHILKGGMADTVQT